MSAKRQLVLADPTAPGAGGATATKTYHHLAEHDDARRALGFMFTDQRNATMACPYDVNPDPQRPHKPIIFRAQSGVNEGRLFWRCVTCTGRDGKPGRLLGLDAELEPSGKRLIDEKNEEAEKEKNAKKSRVVDASGSVVAQGRGVDWTALEEKIVSIYNRLAPLEEKLSHVHAVSRRIEARYDATEPHRARIERAIPVLLGEIEARAAESARGAQGDQPARGADGGTDVRDAQERVDAGTADR